MNFGVSDAIALSRFSYDLYHFCRTAPAELEGLAGRLESIGEKLHRLSNILKNSGLGTWKTAPLLEQHLLDARSCLESLRGNFAQGKQLPSKTKGLVRLVFSQDKLRQVKENLDTDEKAIDEIRMEIIIESSLRNMQQMQHLQSFLMNRSCTKLSTSRTYLRNESLEDSAMVEGPSSVISRSISNVSTALTMAATLTRRPSEKHQPIEIALGPVDRSKPLPSTAEFLEEVIAVAEETGLYAGDTDPARKLERISRFERRMSGTCQAPIFHYEPSTFEDTIYEIDSQPIVDLSEIKPSRDAKLPTNTVDCSLLASESTCAMPVKKLTPRSSVEKIAVPSPRMHAKQQSDCDLLPQSSRIPLIGIASLITDSHTVPMTHCSLNILTRKGIVCLEVNASDKMRTFSDGCVPTQRSPTAALPHAHYRSYSTERAHSPSWHSRTIQHYFSHQQRPIPRLIHPDVEGPDMEPDAPYTITFSSPQTILEKATDSQRCVTSLKYIFNHKEDQISVCGELFGKSLLMTTGTNKITCGGREVAHMSAVALWLDHTSRIYSLTFFPNLTKKKAMPADVEMRIVGICEPHKQPRNPHAVSIRVELMPGYDQHLDGVKATSSSGGLKCTIEFTRLDERASFLKNCHE